MCIFASGVGRFSVHANLPSPGKVAVREGRCGQAATERGFSRRVCTSRFEGVWRDHVSTHQVGRLASLRARRGLDFVTSFDTACGGGTDPGDQRAPLGVRRRPVARDVRVPLPSALSRFGSETTARLYGEEDAPLIVLLGGISADRFVFDEAAWWSGLEIGGDRSFLGVDFVFDPQGVLAPDTHEQALAVQAALDAVGCSRANLVVGASYGGMVALALAEQAPERAAALAIISAGASPHPYATAWREMQRRIIALGIDNELAAETQAIARGMAMLSYRTPRRIRPGVSSADARGPRHGRAPSLAPISRRAASRISMP